MGRRWKNAEGFKAAVLIWAETVGVKPGEIHLRPMRTKWASISRASRRLTFDSGLLTVDREWGEYVILHEVLHVKIPNHGKLFKSFLYSYMPKWEKLVKRYGDLFKKDRATSEVM